MDPNFAQEKITSQGIIAQTDISDVKHAVTLAKAVLAGGVETMTVSLLDKDSDKCISEIQQELPEMAVGASDVTELTQCEAAKHAGASFIITPYLDIDVAMWCKKNEILLIPNCTTPAEMFSARKLGLHLLGFFPADSYGGIATIKAMSKIMREVKWIPLYETDSKSLEHYAGSGWIAAVGCTWVCNQDDAEKDIMDRCRETIDTMLGFELFHVGINSIDSKASLATAQKLHDAFGFKFAEGPGAYYAGVHLKKVTEELIDPTGTIAGTEPGAFYITTDFEVMKKQYLGANGHLGISTNSIERAIVYLKKKGYSVDMKTAYRMGDRYFTVYLEDEFGGFGCEKSFYSDPKRYIPAIPSPNSMARAFRLLA